MSSVQSPKNESDDNNFPSMSKSDAQSPAGNGSDTQIVTLVSRISKLEDENTSLKKENVALQTQYSTREDELRADFEEVQKHFEKYRDGMAIKMQQKDEKIKECQTHIKDLREALDALQNQIESQSNNQECSENESAEKKSDYESYLKGKLSDLQQKAIAQLREYKDVLKKHQIASNDEDDDSKRGPKALEQFIDDLKGQIVQLTKSKESSAANMQRKINDLQAENQNLSTMVEYAKKSNTSSDVIKCKDYIDELEKRLEKLNEDEFNQMRDENILLKAENSSHTQEIASLNSKLKNMTAFEAKQNTMPSHPLFLNNFITNLDSLLGESCIDSRELQDKYIQTADKLTKPIFKKIIELKSYKTPSPVTGVSDGIQNMLLNGSSFSQNGGTSTTNSASSTPLSTIAIGGVSNTPPLSGFTKPNADNNDSMRKKFGVHRNFTYEQDAEQAETLENIIFEQEDYIQKLERTLDGIVHSQKIIAK